MSDTRANILTGMAVISAVILIGVWVSGRDAAGGDGAYSVTARFDQVDGVRPGIPVFLAGIQIGEVSRVHLDPKSLKPVLTFSLRGDVKVPVDSAALIMSDGVLGGKFIKIDAGAEDEALKEGDRFEHVQGAVILEQVLERVVITAEERLRKQKADQERKPAPAPSPAPSPGPSPQPEK